MRLRRNDQWDYCDVCGLVRPMREIVMQDGMKKCTTRPGCLDGLPRNESAARMSARVLSAPHEEGTDRRPAHYQKETDNDQESAY